MNNSKKINSNLKNEIRKKEKNGINKDKKKFSINMINKNISYLWYMEAKQNNNKNLNYKIGNKYEELFMDYIK